MKIKNVIILRMIGQMKMMTGVCESLGCIKNRNLIISFKVDGLIYYFFLWDLLMNFIEIYFVILST
jgi:hypothetical protein